MDGASKIIIGAIVLLAIVVIYLAMRLNSLSSKIADAKLVVDYGTYDVNCYAANPKYNICSTAATTFGTTTYSVFVPFGRKLSAPPSSVSLSIAKIDTADQKDNDLRLSVYPSGITAIGFTLNVSVWYYAIANELGINWIAFQ